MIAHKDIAFRLFNIWKNQQIAIMDGVRDIHPQYAFGYRNTLDRILFQIEGYNDSLPAVCRKLVNEILDSLKGPVDEPYERGVCKALSDTLILFGEVPPMSVSDNAAFVKPFGLQEG